MPVERISRPARARARALRGLYAVTPGCRRHRAPACESRRGARRRRAHRAIPQQVGRRPHAARAGARARADARRMRRAVHRQRRRRARRASRAPMACTWARTTRPSRAARALVGPDRLIGVSCYDDLERARNAVALGADYVAFGSFFASPVKPGARARRRRPARAMRDASACPSSPSAASPRPMRRC